MAVSDYKQLIAWQKAMDLAAETYRVSQCFPSDERFGLTNQIRRAAVSIPSNIAEGQGRGSGKEFRHFLRIANGSRQEAETQFLLAMRFGYIGESELTNAFALAAEVGRLIHGLYASVG